MNILMLKKLMNNGTLLDKQIDYFISKKVLTKIPHSRREILGHIHKTEHNLSFVNDNIKLGYIDWSIVGCYYSIYHITLALIMTKNYYSKNHTATLCILIKEFYQTITKDDLELFNIFVNYEDILFYTDSKNMREKASYTSMTIFNNIDIHEIQNRTTKFVRKIKNIIKKS